MRFHLTLALCVALLAISCTSPALAQQVITRQTETLSHLTANLSIVYKPDHKAVIIVLFSTDSRSKQNVNCLNAYRDIQYKLRDSSGQVMHGDPAAWTKAYDATFQQYFEHPCDKLPWTEKDSRALLDVLYPNLPHGTYTLEMTLAPRGRSDRVPFLPVTLQL